MFFRAPTGDEAERFLQENGLDVLEISLPINADALREGEKRRIIECGQRLPGRVSLHEVIPLGLAHRQPEFRRRLTRRLAEDVRLAQSAGISILTIHTTCTRTIRPLEREWRVSHTRWLARALDRDVTPDYDESVRVMVELLQELSPLARDGGLAAGGSGVALAVENNFRDTRFFGRRIDSVADVLDVLQRAEAPAAAMCFDIFKAFSTERSIPAAIRRAGGRIVNVHASDAEEADTAFFRRRAAVGRGAIDWRAVAEALRAIHYKGSIIFEMMHSVEDIRESARELRQVFASLD
jgi:sugar phosphate isomerase/epimerase